MVDTAMQIRDYNNMEQHLTHLQKYEEQMEDIDCLVASALLEISRGQTLLAQTQKDVVHMQARVHRNENPRCLHYFVWNRGAKVNGLREEFLQLRLIEQYLSCKLSVASAQLPGLQQKQQDVHMIVDWKHQMERRSRQLFNQAVAGQGPTQALEQLRTRRQEQSSLLASERMLLQAVGNSAQQVKEGLSLFQQAEDLYKQAQCMNERAKNVRRKIRNQSARYTGTAEYDLQRLEKQERDVQCMRDKAIKKAISVATQADQVTSNGFTTFITEATDRYPELCASIAEVAFPRMRGSKFIGHFVDNSILGSVGAAMNDAASGCQIQDNVRVARRCASITSQQFWLMTVKQREITTNVSQLEASLRKSKHDIVAEHHYTFNCKRSALWWASLQQHWFSAPKDHRELFVKKILDSIAGMTDACIRTMRERKLSAVMASPHSALLDLCMIY